MIWLLYNLPVVCVVAGGVAGLWLRRRITSVCAGMVCGLLLTLLPYVALRVSGALRLSYGNGLYCIEPHWGGPLVGYLWLATSSYAQVDVLLCTEFVPAPGGG